MNFTKSSKTINNYAPEKEDSLRRDDCEELEQVRRVKLKMFRKYFTKQQSQVNMDNARLKFISKPFGGVVLLTVVHIAFPSVSLAQNQVKQPTTQIKTSPQRQAVPTTTQIKTNPQSLLPLPYQQQQAP